MHDSLYTCLVTAWSVVGKASLMHWATDILIDKNKGQPIGDLLAWHKFFTKTAYTQSAKTMWTIQQHCVFSPSRGNQPGMSCNWLEDLIRPGKGRNYQALKTWCSLSKLQVLCSSICLKIALLQKFRLNCAGHLHSDKGYWIWAVYISWIVQHRWG